MKKRLNENQNLQSFKIHFFEKEFYFKIFFAFKKLHVKIIEEKLIIN